MAKSYRTIITELNAKKIKHCTFTFGRFQPVTIAHQAIFKAIQGGSDHPFVFVSPNAKEPARNPIPVESRVGAIMKLFDGQVRSDCNTIMDCIDYLVDQGFNIATMYVGSDREDSFKDAFKNSPIEIEVVTVGNDRNTSGHLSNVSGSKTRDAAVNGDFDTFKHNIPQVLDQEYSIEWYNDIRKASGKPKQNKSDIVRESYRTGKILPIGGYVVADEKWGRIIQRGTSHIKVIHESGNTKNYWLDGVQEITPTTIIKEYFKTKLIPDGQISYMGYATTNLNVSKRSSLIESNMFKSADLLGTLKKLKEADN